MLRHVGDRRTLQHNLKLATLLGLTAGFVNAAGLSAFAVLTTNITGHVALFAEKLASQDWQTAKVVALWMIFFLAGAFICSLIISLTSRKSTFSYMIPILIEILILLFIVFYGFKYSGTVISKEVFAGSLLFAMGLQNSLVSLISGSVVRTTHLTGTFTDLGIELAQIITEDKNDRPKLLSHIKLRLTIIFFFIAGAIIGAYLFHHFKFNSFVFPVFVLLIALVYDMFRIKASRLIKRKLKI